MEGAEVACADDRGGGMMKGWGAFLTNQHGSYGLERLTESLPALVALAVMLLDSMDNPLGAALNPRWIL